MKFIKVYILATLTIFFVSCKTTQVVTETTTETSTFQKLANLKNVVSIEKRDLVSHFNENYEIWFQQPIDHNDASKGTFKQRVFLGFENAKKPVIVELRGYGIGS